MHADAQHEDIEETAADELECEEGTEEEAPESPESPEEPTETEEAEETEEPDEENAVDVDESSGNDGEAEESDEAGDASDEEEYEEVELEFSEDDIVAYLVDEDDNEIGFVLLDEDGNEVEYYYVEEEQPEGKNEFDIGLTKEVVAETTKDLNSIYHDGAAVAVELKDAFTDIKEALDFKGMFKKK